MLAEWRSRPRGIDKRYAEQSMALSALQNAGISSQAMENTGVLSIQNVTGHSGFDPSIRISIVLGYSRSPSSEHTVIFSVIVVILEILKSITSQRTRPLGRLLFGLGVGEGGRVAIGVLGKKGEKTFTRDLGVMASRDIAKVSDRGAELFHFFILAFQRVENFPDSVALIGDGYSGAGERQSDRF